MSRYEKIPTLSPGAAPPAWMFLTNHAHVLLCLAENPRMRLRDAAQRVCITERAVQSIVQDLEAAGVVTRRRVGRRNTYELHLDHALHHPVEKHRRARDLVRMVLGRPRRPRRPRP